MKSKMLICLLCLLGMNLCLNLKAAGPMHGNFAQYREYAFYVFGVFRNFWFLDILVYRLISNKSLWCRG